MDYRIETNIGPLFLTFTDAKHCCAHNGRGNANESDALFTIRGVKYYVGSCHVHLWKDGQWHLGMEDNNESQFRALHATRQNWLKVSEMYPSASATKTMKEIIVEAVQEYASKHPEALFGAQGKSFEQALETATSERDEAYEKYMLTEKALTDAKKALTAHNA